MKMIQKIIFCVVLLYSMPAQAVLVREVMNYTDSYAYEAGSLRTLLFDACDNQGADKIKFTKPEGATQIDIDLVGPLVIPEDCKGTITLEGGNSPEVVFDGARLNTGGSEAGDSCILHVYSDGNTIQSISFVNNDKGAGVCLFGASNDVKNNRFEESLYGVVVSQVYDATYPGMDGSDSSVTGNSITENDSDGIWVDSENIEIADNTISNNEGHGIYLADGAVNALIGGASFDDSANIIQGNAGGGVVIADGVDNVGHTITHNIISQNGNSFANIDLGADGVSLNDFEDVDMGANGQLNFVDHLQVFPYDIGKKFWVWGAALQGERLEIYNTTAGDHDSAAQHGGADEFLADVTLSEIGFAVTDDTLNLTNGDVLTLLSFDAEGNTSEFSLNIEVGADGDFDGVPDLLEMGSDNDSSNTEEADSDGDGLPDGVEDHNRNGIWDEYAGETAAYLADTDGDGVNDWEELHGDGVYHDGVDSNPLSADNDGDGLNDGAEDKNGNGIWEAYLGESSPYLADSDGDGVSDATDNCPHIENRGQESWYCQF